MTRRPIEKKCLLCGKIFVINHSSQKYCSDECKSEAWSYRIEINLTRDQWEEFKKISLDHYCSIPVFMRRVLIKYLEHKLKKKEAGENVDEG